MLIIVLLYFVFFDYPNVKLTWKLLSLTFYLNKSLTGHYTYHTMSFLLVSYWILDLLFFSSLSTVQKKKKKNLVPSLRSSIIILVWVILYIDQYFKKV